MSAPPPEVPDLTVLHASVLEWYREHARDLPWRNPSTSPWAVLVSEVMLQQTPVARVEPVWRSWMARWPEPPDLAAAAPGELVRAWGRLGYPRRALRLHECARAIVADHDGVVPREQAELLRLPGVGAYTAAAVSAFAHRQRTVVLDTNVRRVLARATEGRALPPPSLTRAEQDLAARHLPAEAEESVRWNVGVMELGALVCTVRAPRCPTCPVLDRCRWVAAGRPPDEHLGRRRTQVWQGSDRQARGQVLALLREAEGPVARSLLQAAATLPGTEDPEQPVRVLASLLADGLVEPWASDHLRLPHG